VAVMGVCGLALKGRMISARRETSGIPADAGRKKTRGGVAVKEKCCNFAGEFQSGAAFQSFSAVTDYMTGFFYFTSILFTQYCTCFPPVMTPMVSLMRKFKYSFSSS